MATIHHGSDADLSIIHGRKVDVRIGLRSASSSRQEAEEAGLEVTDTNDAAAWGDVVVVLVPDTHQQDMWTDRVADTMEPRSARPARSCAA